MARVLALITFVIVHMSKMRPLEQGEADDCMYLNLFALLEHLHMFVTTIVVTNS